MTEPQFAYSNLTLDELRSLAASPQVGTLHAMPQSFRALADRVGEVADLLTHTQVNLHSWWKGPAADQAAEALGKAAAEAREFHGSALAAASAVGRCAQVVEAQQHQMMNIPEVAEPGVTDVVRRPTTPLEALEAARQDTTYQAARQQAVQVVNGIAAQYVETRDELGLLTTTSGENFVVSNQASTNRQYAEKQSDTYTGYVSHSAGKPHNQARRQPFPDHPAEAHVPLDSIPAIRNNPKPAVSKKFEPVHQTPETAATGTSRWSTRINNTETRYKTPTPETSATSLTMPYEPVSATESQHDLRTPFKSTSEHADRDTRRDAYPKSSEARSVRSVGHAALEEHPHLGKIEPEKPIGTGEEGPLLSLSPGYRSPFDRGDAASGQMIPPYGGIGHVPRMRETRSKCPDYLRERRNAWLPDTIAAPPDGVLSPEWFQQS